MDGTVCLTVSLSGAASVTGERSLVARLSRAAGDFSTFNLYEDSDEGEEQGDAAEDEDAASDNLECGIREVYPATIPAGKVDLDSFEHLTLSGEKNVAVECSIACCELGPRKCQYAWILENECIAVACSKEHADKCLPGNMGVKASIYVSMSYTAPSVTTVAAATAIGQCFKLEIKTHCSVIYFYSDYRVFPSF